jgi:superfamily II DNA or RNA helicase
MPLICHRKELYALQKLTNNFSKIASCDSLKEYFKLVNGKKADWYTKDQTQGLIFGEPMLNFWLVEQGPARNVDFSRYATRDEDYHGIDAYAVNRLTGQDVAINHKFYRGGQVVKSDLAGLSMATWNASSIPMLVTTAFDVSIPAQEWLLSEANGVKITGDVIESTTHNAVFWKKFADYLHSNVAEWKTIEQNALLAAQALSTRTLDNWQAQDIITLSSVERGVFIAPPGSGKTTIEAKLSEQWMSDRAGPVLIISKNKSLTAQVLSNLVVLNKHMPDRIACYSDSDHEMDIRDALSVGTLNVSKDIINQCYKNKTNVYIASVANHGSVELLKWHLTNKIPVRVIIDELAEIIPGSDSAAGEILDKNNTLDMLYKLSEADLLEKCFGFDAVWKFGPYRGMNDKTFWGQSTPLVKHEQHEMTDTHNVLVPVHLFPMKITQAMIDEASKFDVSGDRNRHIEIAGSIAAMKHQLARLNDNEQTVAKAIVFASGAQSARFTKAGMTTHLPQLELNEVILAATGLQHRKQTLAKMANTNTHSGCISNYDIWTKGMDVPDLTAAILGYGRVPSKEKLTHIIGRATRRASGERGLSIDTLIKKPEGCLYVPYVEGEDDGGQNFSHIAELHNTLYEVGITSFKQTHITGSTSRSSSDIDPVFAPNLDMFEEVSATDIDRIRIERAIEVRRRSAEEIQAQIEHSKSLNDLFAVFE